MNVELITKLQSIGAIKFGQFEIKKDFLSPFHVDFSTIFSHPEVAKEICAVLWEKARHLNFDLLCGVPTIGSCFSNFISWHYEYPMVIKRMDGKEGCQILGKYKSGQKCLVIGDILLSGQRTLGLIDNLEEEGLAVSDVLSLIDLQLDGKKRIKGRGIVSHSVIGISEVIQILFDEGKLAGDHFKLATDFLESV